MMTNFRSKITVVFLGGNGHRKLVQRFSESGQIVFSSMKKPVMEVTVYVKEDSASFELLLDV